LDEPVQGTALLGVKTIAAELFRHTFFRYLCEVPALVGQAERLDAAVLGAFPADNQVLLYQPVHDTGHVRGVAVQDAGHLTHPDFTSVINTVDGE